MDILDSVKIVLKALESPKNGPPSTNSLRSQFYQKYHDQVKLALEQLLSEEMFQLEEYLNLRNVVSRLKNTMEAKLLMTAEEDDAKMAMVHRMCLENQKVQLKISDLREERQAAEIKFDVLLKSKLEVIDCHRSVITEANENTTTLLNSEIIRSETAMKSICQKNIEDTEELQKTLEELEQRLADLLSSNLQKEQAIRSEKHRVQVEFKRILDKYDSEITSRTLTVRELKTIYDNDQSFLQKLEQTCNAQDIQYQKLMHQKEMDEKQLQEEKIFLFIMNRAAKIIQHNWRLLMAKKRLKKGKRKGKSKKA